MEGTRPKLGRKPRPVTPDEPNPPTHSQEESETEPVYETLDGTKPHPGYLEKGPLITKEIFDKWKPEYLGLPERSNTRPARSTRNPDPKYVDSLARPG